MGLLIDEEELKNRVQNAEVIYHRIGKKGNTTNHENAGRKPGDTNIVPFVRELIASEAINKEGTAKEIAEAWNVSESSVNNYKNGRHTNKELKGKNSELLSTANSIVKQRKEKMVDSLTLKLMDAMESIKIEKISNEKPIIQSQIIRNLANTLEKIEGKEKEETHGSDVHYHVHIPPPINIEQFNSVTIEEKPLK